MKMPKATSKLTITVDATDRPVRLAELRRLCDQLAACLDHLATVVLEGKRPPPFAITDIRTGSVGLEVSPDETRHTDGAAVIRQFKATTKAIYDDSANGEIDVRTLELMRKLVLPVAKRSNSIWIDDFAITTGFLANIDKRLEKPIRAYGQLKGQLDTINVHAGKNEFLIYPPIRTRGVRCQFPESLTEKAGTSLKRNVTISGTMLYLQDAAFPYLVHVDDIEIHPPDDQLPTLNDLRGIAPDLTNSLTTLDFIRSLENG